MISQLFSIHKEIKNIHIYRKKGNKEAQKIF